MMKAKKARPTTLMIPVKNAADKKRVADVEEALSRQVGFKFTMDTYVDDKKQEYRVVGWPMKRQDIAAVDMLMRRGKKPNDPALLTATEVHKDKRPVEMAAEKAISKKKV